MKSRLMALTLVLVGCATAFALSGTQAPAKRKCVGITAVKLNQRVVRVYRAFEDGSVEILDDGGNPQATWQAIGK